MPPVAVRILHPGADPSTGILGRWVLDVRATLAERHRVGFAAAGADDVAIVTEPPDGRSFGERLRELVAEVGSGGLVVLGSGSIPLATDEDLRSFVTAAAGDGREALANNRYSADVVAISRVETLSAIPDLRGDNALPRWLSEVAGYRVTDLRRRWRLAIDIDGPVDVLLTGGRAEAGRAVAGFAVAGRAGTPGVETGPVAEAIHRIAGVAAEQNAELLVSGRTSAGTLAWLERSTASRTRAWVEERGLRTSPRGQRPPASVLGALLERDGPGSLGHHFARFADAALVDTRVLLAHRLGADEAAWPIAEDRFASDLLLPGTIADPWLRELTASAAAASIPVLLGGHTLVGPGVRLVVGRRSGGPRWT
jgi:hypothetical protein